MELGNTIQEELRYRAVTHLDCRLLAVEELNIRPPNTILMSELFF
jgi:hypothetical protein